MGEKKLHKVLFKTYTAMEGVKTKWAYFESQLDKELADIRMLRGIENLLLLTYSSII